MSSTQYYLAQSLDGYMAERDGGIEWLTGYGGEGEVDASDAIEGAFDRFFAGVGALAMGSATYEFILAEASGWPYEDTPSWVFSSRDLPVLEGADVRIVSGPVRPVHERMLEAAGDRNVWIVGGGAVAMQFVAEGLLDELLVTVAPVVLGDGIPTFPGRVPRPMRLVGTRPFGNGMVELRYALSS